MSSIAASIQERAAIKVSIETENGVPDRAKILLDHSQPPIAWLRNLFWKWNFGVRT